MPLFAPVAPAQARDPATRPRLPPVWAAVLFVAIAVGIYFRLDQFTAQVLIDDEWHAVHQVLRRTPAQMFLDFGFADYSIPLGILAWHEARWFGLSETLMRAPMMLCGLATLIVFPWYVARRFAPPVAATFAVLLAMSPLLVIYSRMARPYAITLLLGWIAHVAFQRFWSAPARRGSGAAAAYAGCAALATWLHPIIGPFVLAPLVWAFVRLTSVAAAERRRYVARFAIVSLVTGAAIAALVLPPLLANPQSMANKSGIDVPNAGTLIGVWYAWLGTPSGAAVVLCVALAALGARNVWNALPATRTVVLGAALTLAALFVTRPMWIFNPISLARYLLPIAPLLLLAVAAGAYSIAQRVGSNGLGRGALSALVMTLPVAALAVQSPLADMLRHPNRQTLHLRYHFDFRPDKNPYLPYEAGIPLSPFWASLRDRPPGSVRVAAAPFYFESYDWDAPRWETASGQGVIPGYLTGLCVERRYGETPQDALYQFRNAAHLADDAALAARGVDLVVWQKPYPRRVEGRDESVGTPTAHCEAALRDKFGAPLYEDASLIAFRIARDRPTDAPR